MKRFELDQTNDCQYNQGYLVKNKENRYICFKNRSNKTLCAFNIQTGETNTLPIKELLNAYTCGFPGTLLKGNSKAFRLTDGILSLGDYKFTVEFGLPSRDAISYKSNTLYVPIDNDKMRVLHTHEAFEKYNDVVKLHILNKSKDTWSTVVEPGNYSSCVRSFNHWLVGYYAFKNDTKIREIPEKIKLEDRRDTGLPIQYNPVLENFNLTGTLFLYNIDTDKKITIETNEEDSEILLIQNDEIYYRIGSTIYKALIRDNAITNRTELVSAPFVPDIHWAFVN